jgi:predicted alpha-1,2-mannosidase
LKTIAFSIFLIVMTCCSKPQKHLTDLVNPFLGTAPLIDSFDIGYSPPKNWRVWAGLTYPGSSLPNAMVQLSPITEWRSGAGYEYEDSEILGFTHTNKGHWNLCHIPFLPAVGEINVADFGSKFNHKNESAQPGYYQVFLERYGINAELTSTLRCGFHKYTFKHNEAKKLIVNLSRSNERVRNWELEQDGDFVFKGFQNTGSSVYFYAVANHKINKIESLKEERTEISVIDFINSKEPLEIKIGLSFVSTENAKENLEVEMAQKSFTEIRNEATTIWEKLLSKIQVSGGTEREKELFYSSLYRTFLWPALRSDTNGEFTDASGEVVKKDFRYYTIPSLWDTYRNKLVLLEMLSPDLTADVIQSLIDNGEKTGFMPTFFHGDHAAPFISGSYLRGIRGYDVKSAYQLLLNNATKEGGTRPYISEYIEKGYISTPDIENPYVETKAKAGVTKTLEYAYDDYSLALLAKELGDTDNYKILMKRSLNYKNLYNQTTGFMCGRLENGDWVKNFNPEYPYYEYMYREANAWQSTFFAPHDTKGLIALYESENAFEAKLDSLYSIPWNSNYIARNVSSFIGQYCQGNQPDHSFPYLYHFMGKPEKSQVIIDSIMNHFYGMGEHGLALCGMDDAGEMSAWYVFAAMGIYPYSPGDADYIISVPLFNQVKIELFENTAFTITKKNNGNKIINLSYDKAKLNGFFISYQEMKKGKELIIETESTIN